MKESRGHHEAAMDFYKRAIAMLEHFDEIKQYSEMGTAEPLIDTLERVSNIAHSVKDYTTCTEYASKAVNVCEAQDLAANGTMFGRRLALLLTGAAGKLHIAGKPKEACPMMERGLEISKRYMPPNHPHTKETAMMLAMIKGVSKCGDLKAEGGGGRGGRASSPASGGGGGRGGRGASRGRGRRRGRGGMDSSSSGREQLGSSAERGGGRSGGRGGRGRGAGPSNKRGGGMKG